MTDVLPGVTVQVAAQALPTGPPTVAGRLFAVGITRKGPIEPTVVGGASSFVRRFGARTHFDTLSDPLRAFWRVGGSDVVIARVVGPAATAASVTLDDDEAADTLEISAAWPGDAGNDIGVEVGEDGDGWMLTVTDDGQVVEVWRRLDDIGDAVLQFEDSDYIRGTDLASGSSDPTPAVGSFQLAGGDDDRASIGDADWQAALDRIDADLGPGQVIAPTRDSTDGHDQLVDHAEENNRVAFLDAEEGASKSDLVTLSLGEDRRQAALFAPYLRIELDGRIRKVPASAVAAGLAARLDAEAPTAHLAPDLERSRLVEQRSGRPVILDVATDFDDVQHAELNGAGVNVFRHMRGQVLLRGWRSLSDQPQWVQLSQVRYIMGLSARLADISERFVFRTLTRPTIKEYGNRLGAELLDDYEAGALFGDDPDAAYAVDVSDDVNPPQELQEGRLHALVDVTVAPFAERIIIDVLKRNLA